MSGRNRKAQKTVRQAGGGVLSGIRRKTRSLTSGSAKKKPLTFWDVLFWVVAGGLVLLLLYRRLS